MVVTAGGHASQISSLWSSTCNLDFSNYLYSFPLLLVMEDYLNHHQEHQCGGNVCFWHQGIWSIWTGGIHLNSVKFVRLGFFSPVDPLDSLTGCSDFEACGICGDSLELSPPRPHEAGGKFGGGNIVRTFNQGDLLPLVMEFTQERTFNITVRLCPVKGRNMKLIFFLHWNYLIDYTNPDDECLDKYFATTGDGIEELALTVNSTVNTFRVLFSLPSDLICSRYVVWLKII